MSSEVEKAKAAKRSEITIFERIIKKEIKADVIYEDEKCLAFNDISPQAPVHFLVIPKRKIPMLEDVTANDSEVLQKKMRSSFCFVFLIKNYLLLFFSYWDICFTRQRRWRKIDCRMVIGLLLIMGWKVVSRFIICMCMLLVVDR